MNARVFGQTWCSIYRFLMPPKHVGPEKVGVWLRRMSLSIMILGGAIILNNLLIYGFVDTELTRVGARETDRIDNRIEEVESQSEEIRETLTDIGGVVRRTELINTKRLHCDAIEMGNKNSARQLNMMLSNLIIEYRMKIDSNVNVPTCRQLGSDVDES